MNRTITYRIPEEQQLRSIQSYLKSLGYSSQNLTALKQDAGSVLLNDAPVILKALLHGGEILTVHIREYAHSEKIPPVELPLDILYEDEDLMVLNKPAGMPIHTSMNNYTNTLANGLAYYFARQDKPFVFRCINRLDRDTSGLTVIAKHAVSAAILGRMVAAKGQASAGTGTAPTLAEPQQKYLETVRDHPIPAALHREYLGIVRGHLDPAAGTIDAPLSRKSGSIIERTVDFDHGERAVTHYHVLEEKNGHSLVSLELETGRTHQIRVHMLYLGHPLIGDYLYNPDREYISRQALHAYRLSFPHPMTGEPMTFTAPLPEDMRRVLI